MECGRVHVSLMTDASDRTCTVGMFDEALLRECLKPKFAKQR